MKKIIINTYDQLRAAGGGVAISYRPAIARACQPAKWSVFRVVRGKIVSTDPKAHWTDEGQKSFLCMHPLLEGKKTALAEAQKWAKTTYGVDCTARNRLGSYVPADVQARFPIPKRAP